MKLIIVLACVVFAATADVAHIKAAKAKFVRHLSGANAHHQHGILSHVPPYKLGHDIPLVTHSVVKPVVVSYPPTAAVAAVKVPLSHPLVPHYPAPLGHRVHGLPHPHYALRFPHSKYYVKQDDHFHHHHHHHVAAKPLIPVVPAPPPPVVHHAAPVAPVLPVAQPTAAFAHPIPAPPPAVPVIHGPAIHPQPVHITSPPISLFHQSHFLKPWLSAAPAPAPQQYVIRPGAAVQTSYFAQYPRYPFLNSYQSPIYPLSLPHSVPVETPVPAVHQVQFHQPHFHVPQVVPQLPQEDSLEHHTPNVFLQQTPSAVHPVHSTHEVPQPTLHVHPTEESFHIHPTHSQPSVHLHPTQATLPLEHDGWSPVLAQPQESHHDSHYPEQSHHFVQEQGNQVYEHPTDEQYHDFQHQIHQHIQQQIEQAQYEQSLNNQHQMQQEYGAPQPTQEYGLPSSYQQQDQEYHAQQQAQEDYNLAQNQYNAGQPGQEYGQPVAEGRGAEEDQRFHNHIPLALQPPIDRPLDHFH
ncbi:unnamed protein product [Leptidea sinapis]|uniref:VM domain-containing protein n=1 Tax=Leptidea sinapis TaxID=189913 RepID=A0A5E4QJY4_9NEOP|nr:unnamed protein product [Leptidea sinapis]